MLVERETAGVTNHIRFFGPQHPRHLLIVRRDQPDVHRYLAEAFRGVNGVEVILDRREQHGISAHLDERRTARPSFDIFGLLIVRC